MKKLFAASTFCLLLPTSRDLRFTPTFAFLLFTFAFCLSSHSQNWSTPVSLTDSLTHNRNATFTFVHDFYGGPDYYIFWERSVDSTYTDIYAKKYYENDEPFEIISDGIHHFKNPMVFTINYLENIFGLIYESDQNGNIDLFCMIYTESGFYNPMQITFSPSDDTHARANGIGDLVWERDNKIYYSHLLMTNSLPPMFTEEILLSDSLCHNPDISYQEFQYGEKYISWIKETISTNEIEFIYQDYNDTVFSAPETLYDGWNNSNLNFTNSGFWGDWPLLFWDREINDTFQILGYEYYTLAYYESIFSQSIPFMPVSTIVPIIVDDLYTNGYLSFVREVESQTDIYASIDPYYFNSYLIQYENITNTPYVETHPQIFHGQMVGCWQDFPLIWETFVNDHWQLNTSISSVCMSGIEETKNESQILIAPNPAKNSFTISYPGFKDKDHQIDILDSKGRLVLQIEHPNGSLEKKINTSNFISGVYYIKISNENSLIVSSKLIIQ